MLKDENYDRHLLVGLVLTLLILVGMTFYILNENNRLEAAAATFVEERIHHGREIYTEQCAACHGTQGEGGLGTALNNKSLLKSTFDEVFFSVIRSGVPSTQMPAWSVDFGGPLTDEDVRSVVAFIRDWEPTAPEIDNAGALEAPEIPQEKLPTGDPDLGADIYAGSCKPCHGENGEGGGGGAFPPLKPNEFIQGNSDSDLVTFLKVGRAGTAMAGFDGRLSEDELANVVAFLELWQP